MGTGLTQPPTVVRVVALVLSQKSTEITLKMLPGAAINGRILHPSGKPAPNTLVEILRRVGERETSLLELVIARSSDDRGEFRAFSLRPVNTFCR